MKMAKKFMALALAVVLSVGCAFCVSADGSRTKNITVSQEQSKIYEVLQKIEETDGFKELKEEYPEIAEVLQKVGEGKMDMKEFIDFLKTLAAEEKDETRKAKLEDVIEKLEKKEFVTGFVQFKVLDFDKAVKSAEDEDKYEVDLSVPSITDEMENIQLLCYNKEKNEWSIAEPISVDKKNKTIKVALEDLCYFAIIADAKEESTTK
ncbi:Uncharacterised protein [uncultured Blautia sp.]|nr:hypothetical protein [uncultured Blautia sp.]SCI01578.1 Uncharacterised protein [uncultured Blautia sp.]